ncbi:S8 family serine peptidase [Pseudomonas yamanorum]|nr:S8 family serine peptidase [Pseudomonas yamanorum]
MHEVKFWTKDAPSLFLQKSPELIIVRNHQEHRRTLLTDIATGAEQVISIPDAQVQVFKIPLACGLLTEQKSLLRERPEVRFAGSVLVDMHTGEPLIYTENIFIKFINVLTHVECKALIEALGLSIKEHATYATNAYFVSQDAPCGSRVCGFSMSILQRPDVEYCYPEILRQRSNRAIHSNQWHLKKTMVTYQVMVDASANVEAAHELSQGENVVIAVIDDGFDLDHPEFASPGKIVAAKNFDRRTPDDDPRPSKVHEVHGTAAAGVACADGTHGASGVAPKSRLMPIKLTKPLGARAEATAFMYAADKGADIISCSWGPPEGHWADPSDPRHKRNYAMPAHTRLAIEYATTKGRDGKGCLVFFGAGNGNECVDGDGYASNPNVIAVAACNDQNRRSAYSDFGKAIWCAFPSGDQANPDPRFKPASSLPVTRGIRTTDLSQTPGKNRSKDKAVADFYTETFSGTSSACPGAAGVAALILAIHPGLSAKEVRQILADCCDKISHPEDGEAGQYDSSGHSQYYGYGRLNAFNAVRLTLARRTPKL